jgi:hypothetical protein
MLTDINILLFCAVWGEAFPKVFKLLQFKSQPSPLAFFISAL